jgi:hypothetical protein
MRYSPIIWVVSSLNQATNQQKKATKGGQLLKRLLGYNILAYETHCYIKKGTIILQQWYA